MEARPHHPQTRVIPVIVTLVGGLVFMLPFVVARVVLRLQSNQLGIDDWIIIVAGISNIVSAANGIVLTKYGLGYHLWDIRIEWLRPYYQWSTGSLVIFNFCMSLPKISICVTYLRLFSSRKIRWFCYILITSMTCWLISVTLVTVFQCRPIGSTWNLSIAPQRCIDLQAFCITASILNAITDFVVYLWSVPTLWSLKLPMKTRLGLVLVFSIGCLVCVSAIVRTRYIRIVFTASDHTYHTATVWIAGSVEANLGIIFACMHAIRPVLTRVLPGLFNSPLKDRGHQNRRLEISVMQPPPRPGHVALFQALPDVTSTGAYGVDTTEPRYLTQASTILHKCRYCKFYESTGEWCTGLAPGVFINSSSYSRTRGFLIHESIIEEGEPDEDNTIREGLG